MRCDRRSFSRRKKLEGIVPAQRILVSMVWFSREYLFPLEIVTSDRLTNFLKSAYLDCSLQSGIRRYR